jgi:hypothetical protein
MEFSLIGIQFKSNQISFDVFKFNSIKYELKWVELNFNSIQVALQCWLSLGSVL